MPTEIDATFLQTIITAFTEHPDSLKTLLENKPINDALAAYLNAAAERLRPKQEWDEIYTVRGKTKRSYEFIAPEPGLFYPGLSDQVFEVVSLARLFYDERMKVAILFGGFTEASRNFIPREMFTTIQPLWRGTEIFDDPVQAIHWAQRLLVNLDTLFLENTTPIAEAAQDAGHADA